MERRIYRYFVAVLISMFIVFAALLLIGFIAALPRQTIGPKTLGDTLNENIGFPVYTVDPDHEVFGSLTPSYYFLVGESDADHLTAYFNSLHDNGEQTRLAYLRICNLCSPPLGPGGLGLAIYDEVSVRWADDFGAWTCDVPEFDEAIQAQLFTSCVYWEDEENFHYRLYTMWNSDQTVEFANSLVKVKRGGS